MTRMGTLGAKRLSGGSKLGSMLAGSMLSSLKRMNAANFDKRETQMSFIESNYGESVFEITDEKIKQHFDKKISQNKTNFDMQVKNMKPIVMQMAVEFLLKQSVSLAELLTN